MKGDFSRVTFDHKNNFTRVLMQQGRVQLDADWNEQTAILLHYLQTLAADLIGPHGGPKDKYGFGITKVDSNGKITDLKIGEGRYYVDGLLCENLSEVSYNEQRHYPKPAVLPTDFPYLVYLDVWERHITWLQEDGIREVALGGLDTATRAQLVWQVRVTDKGPDGKDLGNVDFNEALWKSWVESWQAPNRGKLKAQAKVDGDDTNPCTASPEARYRGAENQLYRVEIQSYDAPVGGTKALVFKWSRENGSVIFPVRSFQGMTARLDSLGRDEAASLTRGDWVELLDDVIDLSGKPGPLLKVTEINAARATVTLEGSTTGIPVYKEGEEAKLHAYLRRWDHQEMAFKDNIEPRTPNGGVLLAGQAIDDWIDLERGIQVQFQDSGIYRPGDYWLIPARTATGEVEWPLDNNNKPEAIEPHGVEHHYAPLAIVKAGGDPENLRRKFDYTKLEVTP